MHYKRLVTITYHNLRELVQAKPSSSNNGMNRRGIFAVVISINSTCILLWLAFAYAPVYCTSPLIVVYMAKENQIHLHTQKPKHATMVSVFRSAGHFFSYQPDVVKNLNKSLM